MLKTGGLRRYLYEHVFWSATNGATRQGDRVITVSQARAIRSRVDELLASRYQPMFTGDANGGRVAPLSVHHPRLPIGPFLTAVDDAFTEVVPGYRPQFGDHDASDPLYQYWQERFMQVTGTGGQAIRNPLLPVSPYDPVWGNRRVMRMAGTHLRWIPDDTIAEANGGRVDGLDAPRLGGIKLYRMDTDAQLKDAGRALTADDLAGLTALSDKLSRSDYEGVRDWIIDGARGPDGRVRRNRFMSPRAVSRADAILTELRDQGIGYQVRRDRSPGQAKVVVDGGMEIRLVDLDHEEYAGARVYDDGVVTRFSTPISAPWRGDDLDLSPQNAVDLLHVAQGSAVARRDVPGGAPVGAAGGDYTVNGTLTSGAYHTERAVVMAYDDRPDGKLVIRRDGADHTLPMWANDPQVAREFVQTAVTSAQGNMRTMLDVETLIEQAERDPESVPDYASDPEIAAIQRAYWDVLTGATDALLRPGATEQMYREHMEEIGELQVDDAPDMGNLVYLGTPAEQVRAHAEDVPLEVIGTWELLPHDVDGEWVDQRFDAAKVARWMTSANGQWRNMEDLAAMLRATEVNADELIGTDFRNMRFKDRLIRFDPTRAVPIDQHESEFIRGIGDTVRGALERNAIEVQAIDIDDQGVISWSGHQVGRRSGEIGRQVNGQIGQVFDVGEHDEIITRFASGQDSLIVPGYEARIRTQRPGEIPTPIESRTVLRGYKQVLDERISHRISVDVTSGRTAVGEPASLNNLYSQLYGSRHPVETAELARTDEWTATILDTEARRIRYPNVMRESTMYAEHRSREGQLDPADDNTFDPWRLTGGRNLAILTATDARGVEPAAGYLDPVMTGNQLNQGLVRYLVAGASVADDGTIIPGDPGTPEGRRTPLALRPELAAMSHDPFDRQQMAMTTLTKGSEVTEPVRTALMTFGGWTADDPIVVSREFAETHRIRGAGGRMRPLVIGDKISDLHGNKGVISLVVDRGMDPDEAAEQGLEEEVTWFRNNPDLDVVMSPFSLISRRNAGSARELMDGTVSDLVDPNGEIHPGSIGEMRFVITHMAVDAKTRIYDDDEVRAGHGRKASAQLAWALQSADCPAIMREFYQHNSGAEAALREHMITMGIDMDADGRLRVIGADDGLDERPERRLFPMPELQVATRRGRGGTMVPVLNHTAMRREFGELIGDRGGDLEIPFPLIMPTGQQTEQHTSTTWRLPVLSSHLRSGQEFADGTVITHDYTRSYQDLFHETCRYRFAQSQLAAEGVSDERRARLEAEMSEAQRSAQRHFDAITGDLSHRVFEGKRNGFRNGIMSSRLPNSATMVWTANPELDIDQVAISSIRARQMSVKEGDHVIVWRDPILRDSGVRYLRVAIDDRLTGAAINPVQDKCFDGDFDGDAIGMTRLTAREAHDEAMAKFSVEANLLDLGVRNENGAHPLATQLSLDTRVAVSRSLELAEAFEKVVSEINRDHMLKALGEGPLAGHGSHLLASREHMERLNELYHRAQRSEFGSALSFASVEEHLDSIKRVCVDTGAKGSTGKLDSYAHVLRDGISREEQEASMAATAIKSHGTGMAGMFSQRAVRALRNAQVTVPRDPGDGPGLDDPEPVDALKPVLELTYPVTQSLLQAKHNAAEAWHKYEVLQSSGRELWRGRLMEHDDANRWRAVYDEEGEPVQATTEQWIAQAEEFYPATDGFGVNVNPDNIRVVAHVLTDPVTGCMRNLEEDPALAGSPMDRLAYGGTFEDLVEMARVHENLYDGRFNEQFAPAATRAARLETQRTMDGLQAPRVQQLSTSVIKQDVIEDVDEAARTRGGNRCSQVAVGVHDPNARIAARAAAAQVTPGAVFTTAPVSPATPVASANANIRLVAPAVPAGMTTSAQAGVSRGNGPVAPVSPAVQPVVPARMHQDPGTQVVRPVRPAVPRPVAPQQPVPENENDHGMEL